MSVFQSLSVTMVILMSCILLSECLMHVSTLTIVPLTKSSIRIYTHIIDHRLLTVLLVPLPGGRFQHLPEFWSCWVYFRVHECVFVISIISLYWEAIMTTKLGSHICMGPGPWCNIKMTSYQYRKSHCGDKTILRPSYLHNGISYTGNMTSLYWIRVLNLKE